MKKKILALTLVFALALALGIGGTLAWLTAESSQVVNTFTVGKITLTLSENGSEYDTVDQQYKQDFKILPGATDDKEPVLTVKKGSEKCYVYALVTNNVKLNGTIVATPNIDTNQWIKVGEDADNNKVLYRYHQVVDVLTANEDASLSVFSQVTYSDTITQSADDLAALNNTTITVQGFAHQSEHVKLDGDGSANKAAYEQFGITYVAPTPIAP